MQENKLNRLGLGALALGHCFTDMQTSALAVMVPLIYTDFKLDYAAAALIVTLNSFMSSLIQPLFGVLSDKRSLRWLLPLGCLTTALGMVAVLFMPNYWLVLLAVMFSGLGSAAFHPEGSRNANYVSGGKKATGLSIFFVGGNIGFALGPIFVAIMLGIFGKAGVIFLLIPGFIGFLLLWRLLPLYANYAAVASIRLKAARAAAAKNPTKQGGLLRTMSVILSVISVRSMIQTGMVTFIPLYFATQPGENKDYAAFLLAVFLLAGAVGTLAGGQLADRLGRKNVLVGSMLIVSPMFLLFLNSTGLWQVVTLAIAGSTLIAASSLTVVMAQEAMPNSIGLASGLTLGLGFGAGGIGAVLLGKYADSFGLSQTMVLIALLPLVVVVLSLQLKTGARVKKPAKTEQLQPQTEAVVQA